MKFFGILLLQGFLCEDFNDNTPWYSWKLPVFPKDKTNVKIARFPNEQIICRAKTSAPQRNELYLVGEVVGEKCIFGWNEIEETEKFQILEHKCIGGSKLDWHRERYHLESVLDEVMVQGKLSIPGKQLEFCLYARGGFEMGFLGDHQSPIPILGIL